MAASHEFAPTIHESGEMYGHSLRTLKSFGRAILSGAKVELSALYEHVLADFDTAIAENITTDMEFTDVLILDTPKIRKMVDGHIVAPTGERIIDLVTTGYEHSLQMAEDDPEYSQQAVRDYGDVLFASAADNLAIGETAAAMSFYPQEWYERNPDSADQVGYRRGMSVQHVVHRISEDEFCTITNIIKHSDKHAMSATLKDVFGQEIDPELHSDHWIRDIHIESMTLEETLQIGVNTVKGHAAHINHSGRYYSTTDFMNQQVETTKQYADTYLPSLAVAAETRENDVVLQELAASIVRADGKSLKPEIKDQLTKIAQSESFGDDDARLMQSMIRYATVEDLRQRLPEFFVEEDKKLMTKSDNAELPLVEVETNKIESAVMQISFTVFDVDINRQQAAAMAQAMAQNIVIGVRAGRTLGGCNDTNFTNSNITGEFDLVKLVEEQVLKNDLFGTVDKEDSETKMEDCEFVSKECPKCGKKDVVTTCKDGVFYGSCGCTSGSSKQTAVKSKDELELAA